MIGLIASHPIGDLAGWNAVVESATRDMTRAHFHGNFSNLGEHKSVIRAGIDYGVQGAVSIFMFNCPSIVFLKFPAVSSLGEKSAAQQGARKRTSP